MRVVRVSNSRPESIDLFGVHHRYGCIASRVTSKPASIVGRTMHTCADCGARSMTHDDAEPDDDPEKE